MLQTDWQSERPWVSVRRQAKSRPSLRIVLNVVLTITSSTSFITEISRCHMISSEIGSKRALRVGGGHRGASSSGADAGP